MRKTSITIAAVLALAVAPSAAGAAEVAPPGACDLLNNVICHYLPPDEVSDVCGIVDATTALDCAVTTAAAAPPTPQVCTYVPDLEGHLYGPYCLPQRP